MPLYYEAKVGFTLWLQLPQFNVSAAAPVRTAQPARDGACAQRCRFGCLRVLPSAFQGASILYASFIEPFLKEKEEKIDFAIANSGRIVKEHSTKIISSITDKAGSLSSEVRAQPRGVPFCGRRLLVIVAS